MVNPILHNNKLKKDVSDYLANLFDKRLAKRIEDVELRKKVGGDGVRPSKLLKDYEIDEKDYPDIEKSIGVCPIKLRVDEQPQSGLNLYFSKGRKNQKNQYATRPWYEVEIGTEKKDRDNEFYPVTEINAKKDGGKSREGSFEAYANDDGKFYKFKMRVSADFGKNIASSNESGGRETLGKFIKGKLEKRGLINEGDVITSETLMDYGNDTLELHKISDSAYILNF